MQRNQFTFYASYYEAVKELSKKDQTSVILAICAYALNGEEPELSGVPKAIFALIRPTLDAGKAKANNRLGKTKEEQNENKATTNRRQTDKEKEKEREKENECYSAPACAGHRFVPTGDCEGYWEVLIGGEWVKED